MKYYYAHYSRYGVKTTCASDGTIPGDVYAFTSRKERDEFVDNHEWDNYPNFTCRPIGRKEVEENFGRNFVIVKDIYYASEMSEIEQDILQVMRYNDALNTSYLHIEYYA